MSTKSVEFQIRKSKKKRKVAFIIQRCGREVNGGAESHCLTIARRMTVYWQTEILTTCALGYVDWANHYPVGEEEIDGVLLRRFPVAETRDINYFNNLSSQLLSRGPNVSQNEQETWMRAQGPWAPALLEYIEQHADDYDAFFFFTYLYAHTYFGLPKVAAKAFLVPLAHDEWTIYLKIWKRLFELPKGFIFNTVEERDFLRRLFPHAVLEGPIVGVAVDRPRGIKADRFRVDYGIDEPFLLYLGRVDPSKGCCELFEYFTMHRSDGAEPRKLVLLGEAVMPIPDNPDIISLGFVSEQTKWDALSACEALVMPSLHESLSIVLLEAWVMEKPVIVNARCEVLVGQCRRANGGVWYNCYEEFSIGLTHITNGETGDILGKQGAEFVMANYSWPVIEKAYLDTEEVLPR